MKSPITTHVLDTARGQPVPGLAVGLETLRGGVWQPLASGRTDADGRANTLLPPDHRLATGAYRLTFAVGAYQDGFYPEVTVTFTVTNEDQHYHVPLLLSPFGYSTYRGS